MRHFPTLDNGKVDAYIEFNATISSLDWIVNYVEITTGLNNREGFINYVNTSEVNDGDGWQLGENKIRMYIGANTSYWSEEIDPNSANDYGYYNVNPYTDSYNFNRIQIGRTPDCVDGAADEDNNLYCTGAPQETITISNFKVKTLEELGEIPIVDHTSEQGWLYDYYYPVLPKYDKWGHFITTGGSEIYPYGNIPFGSKKDGEGFDPGDQTAPITSEDFEDASLKFNITPQEFAGQGTRAFDDVSGNNNIGFALSDFKPTFDNKTGELKRTRDSMRAKTDPGTNDGAF